ncbi:LytR C-terminal domain-containing protein [Phycicoccus duodecadis]|uniref:LytR cell envelope-related transcriptional attenuator n=1 Tax=Phycicoccus duodecadis TaxID=173053 RepID=A0A2N3YL85_9MICO|nr:LytR C-terminal domain-containing protein [Phycicoccus duodecadis]PKW27631.1 LytR cell envelope-related transcriptional attenuator [Phycicoccus duodecadis]
MSEYTTESPASLEKRARQRRALITLGVLVLGLFFAFWYGLSYYQADENARAARPPAATCTPYVAPALTPDEVTVNVYNATTRPGLAGSTSKLLAERGYALGKVANDPTDRPVPRIVELRYGPQGQAAAQLVLTAMPRGTTSVRDARKDTSVDVVLGSGYRALRPESAPATEGALPMCPAPSSSPTTPASPTSPSPSAS